VHVLIWVIASQFPNRARNELREFVISYACFSTINFVNDKMRNHMGQDELLNDYLIT